MNHHIKGYVLSHEGKFCFSQKLEEIETVFKDKENEILKYMERKEKIKTQVEKEFAASLNIKAFSDIEGMLETALVENRAKIEEETKRLLLKEHNVTQKLLECLDSF